MPAGSQLSPITIVPSADSTIGPGERSAGLADAKRVVCITALTAHAASVQPLEDNERHRWGEAQPEDFSHSTSVHQQGMSEWRTIVPVLAPEKQDRVEKQKLCEYNQRNKTGKTLS